MAEFQTVLIKKDFASGHELKTIEEKPTHFSTTDHHSSLCKACG